MKISSTNKPICLFCLVSRSNLAKSSRPVKNRLRETIAWFVVNAAFFMIVVAEEKYRNQRFFSKRGSTIVTRRFNSWIWTMITQSWNWLREDRWPSTAPNIGVNSQIFTGLRMDEMLPCPALWYCPIQVSFFFSFRKFYFTRMMQVGWRS